MDGTDARINFDAPAVLRKWPSLANQRTQDAAPYLLVDGTLYECLRIDAVPHSMEAVDVPQAAQRCYIAGAMSQRCSRG